MKPRRSSTDLTGCTARDDRSTRISPRSDATYSRRSSTAASADGFGASSAAPPRACARRGANAGSGRPPRRVRRRCRRARRRDRRSAPARSESAGVRLHQSAPRHQLQLVHDRRPSRRRFPARSTPTDRRAARRRQRRQRVEEPRRRRADVGDDVLRHLVDDRAGGATVRRRSRTGATRRRARSRRRRGWPVVRTPSPRPDPARTPRPLRPAVVSFDGAADAGFGATGSAIADAEGTAVRTGGRRHLGHRVPPIRAAGGRDRSRAATGRSARAGRRAGRA